MEIEEPHNGYKVYFNKKALPELDMDDYWLVEGYRATAMEVNKDGGYPIGEKKGRNFDFVYKGVNVGIRYDKTKTGVYPRIKVNGDDLSTNELWQLVDTIPFQEYFFAGVRGQGVVADTREKARDYSTGIQVRALLLGSDTLDFTSERLTASVLARVNDARSYKSLFKAGYREFSYGGLLSQNINTQLEQSTDRIGVYNKLGELISNRKEGKNDVFDVPFLSLDESVASHQPLFRKLSAMLTVSPPEAFKITLADGTHVPAPDFIRIANGVALKRRMQQEKELRKSETTRDVVSDDEDDEELGAFRVSELSVEDIDARLERLKRIRVSLDHKIANWEKLRQIKLFLGLGSSFK
ncbi:hypothetical protein [Polyangium sp. y55x31]|uniref:hypothetical protein n=1 Tax=Polyangium sp. y55x31 TaxID=3042688 RepID=UPI002482CA52|nr:hypothetical protein [Polyangium sp. y55x31]MDI1480582.1 hypothetical protein [Polyangium sp. y55x31]